MNNISPEAVLQALRHVEDPDLKKDLVTLKMIEELRIEGNKVCFSVVLTTPACPLKDMIENACRNAIKHFVSAEAEISINMTSRVTSQRNTAIPGVRNIIAVASGKGGVGKSTVAANLAISLAKTGAKTGLLDADIYGPSIPVLFGVQGERPGAREQDGKMYMVPVEKYGIKLLSIGFFTDPNQAVPWRGPMVSSALKQLFNDGDWGELDYLIVDLPPGTGDIHITLAQTFPVAGAVIVTTPQQVATADARKGINMFNMQGVNVPVLGVIENMAYFSPAELSEKRYYIFGQGGGQQLAQEFDLPFLGELPLVQSICESGDSGQPVATDETHTIATAYQKLAERVAQQVAIQNDKHPQPSFSQ